MKVALVHDYLVEQGGAERVLAALHDIYPEAPIYTSVYNAQGAPQVFRSADVRPSFLQRLTSHPRRYRALLPLYPLAFRSFDLTGYDLVISSASGFAKAVRKDDAARHVCYCHTPPRFVWEYQEANQRERLHSAARAAVRALSPCLARVDLASARGVDRFLANSLVVAARIRALYARDATVVPPPIACEDFGPPEEPGDFFLVVSRLVPYKRIDIVIEAFSRTGRPLAVVGEGRDRRRLEALATSGRIHFAGHLPQAAVRRLLATCRALIVAAEEDFGMAALEANASGRPVIAYAGGGALETVRSGVTGLTFAQQTADSLLRALGEFERTPFSPGALVAHARRYDRPQFDRTIRRVVAEELGEAAAGRAA